MALSCFDINRDNALRDRSGNPYRQRGFSEGALPVTARCEAQSSRPEVFDGGDMTGVSTSTQQPPRPGPLTATVFAEKPLGSPVTEMAEGSENPQLFRKRICQWPTSILQVKITKAASSCFPGGDPRVHSKVVRGTTFSMVRREFLPFGVDLFLLELVVPPSVPILKSVSIAGSSLLTGREPKHSCTYQAIRRQLLSGEFVVGNSCAWKKFDRSSAASRGRPSSTQRCPGRCGREAVGRMRDCQVFVMKQTWSGSGWR